MEIERRDGALTHIHAAVEDKGWEAELLAQLFQQGPQAVWKKKSLRERRLWLGGFLASKANGTMFVLSSSQLQCPQPLHSASHANLFFPPVLGMSSPACSTPASHGEMHLEKLENFTKIPEVVPHVLR